MADLEKVSYLLDLSLNPASSKQAEQELRSQELIQGFPLTLLHVVASSNLKISTRLAGALFFKNYIKRKWIDEDGNHLTQDADLIKQEIIPLMISLPNNLQIQIGEAIAVIADSDFPEKWPTLVDDLVAKLSKDDMITNKGVLTVAHSIFKRWRPLFRSDELFLEIKLVLDKFAVPFLNLLKQVDQQIDASTNDQAQLNILFDVLLLLIKIYYDLNCQDIPEFFEDNLNEGMSIIHKYLVYENPLLKDETEETEIDLISKVKTSISELIQLYTSRYEDIFDPLITQFIQSTWNLLTTTGLQQKYDILVSKLLSFLTSVVKLPKHSDVFNNEIAIKEISEKIIIPNLTVRESDEELFEDDPIEYIRRDLEGSDSDTRRRSSIDFLRELKSKSENLVTQTILAYIEYYLQDFVKNPQNWKYKDLAIYLFTALAAKGSVTSSGVTSTNLLLDVVQFFTNNIVSDLVNDNIHPILKVDAIKYIFTFRNQLTKGQLLESFPILVKHLESTEFVEYTYASITIERILSIKDSNKSGFLFQKTDISSFVQELLSKLFTLILKEANSPEKLAENEFLMKTVMRVLIIAEDSVGPYSVTLVEQLLNIINDIAKNPSNPRFSHFTFESIAVIVKFNNNSNWDKFTEIIVSSFLNLLGADVQEFVPYVFQIFAFLLESSPSATSLPDSFKQLVQPLLSPSVWEYKGNIPAVSRLLRAIVIKDFNSFEQTEALLGVFQKLVSSKANEDYAFELLEGIILSASDSKIQPYSKNIAVLLLQRLQKGRTEKYIKKVISFISKLTIIKNSAYAINFFEQVQPGIFGTIFEQFLLPSLANVNNLLEKKIAVVGFSNLIVNAEFFKGKFSNILIPTIEALLQTSTSESIKALQVENNSNDELEEISSFGSNFSRLAAISPKPFDPLPTLSNLQGGQRYLHEQINKLNNESNNSFVDQLKSHLSPEGLKSLSQLGF
ncbi:hypothetical protein WICMUC_004532 [Wickerhamomyces mucosus]|uniref:Importin N-terminal domain-containing protein n=1 Tax=Wickerhamomyces mucosus TaxID=1378264 RepID=A0A9P8PI60_9ASCO|nr:hypothetical protein WICMUC_004532 [Wickerhamomyces mucosus]